MAQRLFFFQKVNFDISFEDFQLKGEIYKKKKAENKVCKIHLWATRENI